MKFPSFVRLAMAAGMLSFLATLDCAGGPTEPSEAPAAGGAKAGLAGESSSLIGGGGDSSLGGSGQAGEPLESASGGVTQGGALNGNAGLEANVGGAGGDAEPSGGGRGGVGATRSCGVREFGDQGDGTYVNEILPGDYQNTDTVRVGDDYYYVTATKSLSPGMQVLHSKDLVNWEAIGHVIPDITVFNSRFNYDRMDGATRGVWAGSIGYMGGTFYVFFTTPDEGVYVSSATNPAGPWSPLARLISGAGWDDPAPLWDDDGQGYLATTRFGPDPKTNVTYNVHLFKLAADGKSLTADFDQIIYRGQGSEANKLYKINGYYYHLFSQVVAEGRAPFTRRAKVITGPYEAAHQLNHVTNADHEPNQGAILQTPAGDWVFITHHGNAEWSGRGVSLLPLTWTNGWPAAGRVGADGIGNMLWSAKKPILGYPVLMPQTDDDFVGPDLGPQWEWFFQPRADRWSLSERPGFLRLHAFKPLATGNLSKTGNVLTQRPLKAAKNVATAKLDVSHMADGQIAGLGFLGDTWAAIGVLQEQGVRRFVYTRSGQSPVRGAVLPAAQTIVGLRLSWMANANATFSASTDLSAYAALGSAFTITNFGNYMGAKLAIYTANDLADAGYVDIDQFTYPCTGN